MEFELKKDCKYYRAHFVYNELLKRFSEVDCGQCRRAKKLHCHKCKMYEQGQNNAVRDASIKAQINAIIRTMKEINKLIYKKSQP